jgi:hypothetical protein
MKGTFFPADESKDESKILNIEKVKKFINSQKTFFLSIGKTPAKYKKLRLNKVLFFLCRFFPKEQINQHTNKK